MEKGQVSQGGVFAAVGLSLVATVGEWLTTDRYLYQYNWLWLSMFGLAIITLSGAVVDFDPKRWLR